jgi:hypothetical protein
MNMQNLNTVEYGDTEGLQVFLFENALQHSLYKTTFFENGLVTPSYNLFDVEIENLDDWMLPHQQEHQAFSSYLGLQNPINLLDMNWNDEDQFYDWLSSHYYIHVQIAASLGLQNV